MTDMFYFDPVIALIFPIMHTAAWRHKALSVSKQLAE
jgi:hypothetical protein